jgi:hypothetical protein
MASLPGKDNGKSIIGDMASQIKESITDEKVMKGFVDIIVDKELVKRSSALAVLWEGIQGQRKEIDKLEKQTTKIYDPKDLEKPAREELSETQRQAIKTAKERLDKLIKAFEKGMKGDMADVYNINQSLGKSKTGSGTQDSGETS